MQAHHADVLQHAFSGQGVAGLCPQVDMANRVMCKSHPYGTGCGGQTQTGVHVVLLMDMNTDG